MGMEPANNSAGRKRRQQANQTNHRNAPQLTGAPPWTAPEHHSGSSAPPLPFLQKVGGSLFVAKQANYYSNHRTIWCENQHDRHETKHSDNQTNGLPP